MGVPTGWHLPPRDPVAPSLMKANYFGLSSITIEQTQTFSLKNLQNISGVPVNLGDTHLLRTKFLGELRLTIAET